jgi:hypothetical protein
MQLSENTKRTLKFSLHFSGSCMPTVYQSEAFLLLALPTLAQAVQYYLTCVARKLSIKGYEQQKFLAIKVSFI